MVAMRYVHLEYTIESVLENRWNVTVHKKKNWTGASEFITATRGQIIYMEAQVQRTIGTKGFICG